MTKKIEALNVLFEGNEDSEACTIYKGNDFYYMADGIGQELFHSYSVNELYHELVLQGHEVIEEYNGQTYVSVLPSYVRSSIQDDIEELLSNEGYKGQVLSALVDNAMNSKLNDLSDTIDIGKYLS